MQLSLVLALLLLLLVVVGVVLMNSEDARKRRGLIAAAGAIGVLLTVLWVLATPSDPWVVWAHRIDRSVESCNQQDAAVCLAAALERHPPPAAPPEQGKETSVSADFFADLRVADALLDQEHTRDLLWDEFGIDSNEFLGTGFSAPRNETGPARSYADARQREFFVPNLCADVIDNTRCPSEVANVWTWRLDAARSSQWLDRPVSDLLTRVQPSDHLNEWRRQARNYLRISPTAPRQVLVRFARFNPQYYAGTLGRPEANLVFFTSLADVHSITLRDAMMGTGSEALAEPPQDETLFIWVYAPAEGDAAPSATWAALFDYLDRLPREPAAAAPAAPARAQTKN